MLGIEPATLYLGQCPCGFWAAPGSSSGRQSGETFLLAFFILKIIDMKLIIYNILEDFSTIYTAEKQMFT